MFRTLVRGVLLLCLLTNLVWYAHRSVDLSASARTGLRASSESDVERQWAFSASGGELLLGCTARSRFIARVATARLPMRPPVTERHRGALARTPHRVSVAHRHHLKVLAALARADDSPA